jgi:hypothetical protein
MEGGHDGRGGGIRWGWNESMETYDIFLRLLGEGFVMRITRSCSRVYESLISKKLGETGLKS